MANTPPRIGATSGPEYFESPIGRLRDSLPLHRPRDADRLGIVPSDPLRLVLISSYRPGWEDRIDDYSIVCRGWIVGRIQVHPHEGRWQWSFHITQATAGGMEDTLPKAKAAAREAWNKFLVDGRDLEGRG